MIVFETLWLAKIVISPDKDHPVYVSTPCFEIPEWLGLNNKEINDVKRATDRTTAKGLNFLRILSG